MNRLMVMHCFNAIRGALGVVLLVCAALANAQEAKLPGIEDLQRRITALEQAEELSAAEKEKITESYKLAIDRIRAAEAADEEARGYAQSLITLPQERARFRAELESYRPPEITADLETAAPAVLEQQVAEWEGEQSTLRASLEQLQSALQTERRIALQQLISEAQQATQSTTDAPAPALMSEQAIRAASVAQAAEQRLKQARIEALRQRLTSRPARLELMEAEAELLAVKLKGAEAHLTSLRALADVRREQSTAEMVQQFEAFAQALASAPAELQGLAESNIRLARALSELNEKQKTTEAQLAGVQANVATLDAKFEALNRLLELGQFESSSVFGAALRQEWDRASQTTETDAVRVSAEQELTASRVALFHLDERRPPYDVPSMESLQESLGPATEQWAPTIARLFDEQRKLIARLTGGNAQYIDELSALLTSLRYLSERSTGLRSSSSKAISSGFRAPNRSAPTRWLRSAGRSPGSACRQHWTGVVQTALKNIGDRPLKLAVMIALLAAAMVFRRSLKQRLRDMKQHIGKVFNRSLRAHDARVLDHRAARTARAAAVVHAGATFRRADGIFRQPRQGLDGRRGGAAVHGVHAPTGSCRRYRGRAFSRATDDPGVPATQQSLADRGHRANRHRHGVAQCASDA